MSIEYCSNALGTSFLCECMQIVVESMYSDCLRSQENIMLVSYNTGFDLGKMRVADDLPQQQTKASVRTS